MSTPTPLRDTIWDLPPLILHPFNEHISPSVLLDNSKAALMLSGLIPSDGTATEELQKRILAGRYGEVRMLFFLGKDVFRWLEQCMDWVARVPELGATGPPDGPRANDWRMQSFAALLTSGTPPEVKEKLAHWGVADYVSIFSRAIGLHSLFNDPPGFTELSEEFLRNYHRYADALYKCYMETEPYRTLDPRQFQFALYASGEYSRLLESQWESGSDTGV